MKMMMMMKMKVIQIQEIFHQKIIMEVKEMIIEDELLIQQLNKNVEMLFV
jgi:hypothetical protein